MYMLKVVRSRVAAFSILLLLTAFVTKALPLDRCSQYIPEIRKWSYHYFGLNFPYHYSVGQAKQESWCRPNVTAFDGGQGLFQFMPATKKDVEKYIGHFDPYTPDQAIKAQAFYLSKLHKLNFANGKLWLTYCFYNSGYGIMYKEYKRAGVANYLLMKLACKRKILVLKNSKFLDLCDVGYDYPIKIYNYGKQYQLVNDKMMFW